MKTLSYRTAVVLFGSLCRILPQCAVVDAGFEVTSHGRSSPFSSRVSRCPGFRETKPFGLRADTVRSRSVDPQLSHGQTRNNHHELDDQHEHTNTYHRAVHQIEHRAKEKAVFEVAERFTEGVSRAAEKGLFQRFSERTLEGTGKKMTERTAQRIGRRAMERAGDRVVERGAERAVGRAGKHMTENLTGSALEKYYKKVFRWSVRRHSGHSAEKVAERLAERGLERIGEQASIKFGGRLVDQTERLMGGEAWRQVGRSLESSGNRGFRRLVSNSENMLLGRLGRQSFTQTSERAIARSGRRTGLYSVAKATDRSLRRSCSSSGERSLQRAIQVTGNKVKVRVLENGVDRIAIRLAKGMMIILPAVGGILSIYLLKTDVDRLNEERPRGFKPSLAMFTGASIADFLDTILHFCIFVGLLSQWSHHRMEVLEKTSLACAVVSTLCAVAGEIISFRMSRRKALSGTVACET